MSSHPALHAFLNRLLLRSQLAPEERDAILALSGQVIHLAARRDIVSPGQTVKYGCLVAEGWIGRFDQMRNGSRQITAFHIVGDLCDLHSVVAPITGWGITALGDATVLQIAHADLREVARTYPNVALAFWRDTTTNASVLAKWVANVGRADARARVAHLLCELGLRVEYAGLGTRSRFYMPLSQEQIGDAMGLTSVHVNRMLQALRAEGVVSMHKHIVDVQDWSRLTGIADFNEAFLLLHEQAQ